jgi:hypothetical protein
MILTKTLLSLHVPYICLSMGIQVSNLFKTFLKDLEWGQSTKAIPASIIIVFVLKIVNPNELAYYVPYVPMIGMTRRYRNFFVLCFRACLYD